MQNIKNIIFDLGGVFIEIHYTKTLNAFRNLGVSNFDTFYSQHHASNLFELLETGKVTADEFYEAFRQEAPSLEDRQIQIAWNAMLGNFYMEHLEWLQKIRKEYRVFLFSNTNIIHYEEFQRIYRSQTGEENFDNYFVTSYYSHQIGLRKPYPQAFEHIIRKENFNPGETLFVDDTLKNIEGAQKVGLQTIFLESSKDLIQKVQNFI